MYKKIVAAAAVTCSLCATVSAAGDIEITQEGIVVDGTAYSFSSTPFERTGTVYLPLDEALPACGYILGWDASVGGTVCEKDGHPSSVVFPDGDTHVVGYSMYRYMHPVIVTDGKSYIDSDLFADLTGSEVRAADGIRGQQLPDTYRRAAQSADVYDGINVLNRSFIFKSEAISAQSAAAYAGVVNTYAEELPDVNVYCMLVPDAGEFYAPREYYCDQLSSFEIVYDFLKNVTPVPVADALLDHADEKIYFDTDHHWTQRGAYYAWERFMKLKGESTPVLSEFKQSIRDDFKGSFIKEFERMGVTNAVDSETELFERFLPIRDVHVKIYNDMKMEDFAADMPLVNTYSNDYGCFIYGDCPLTVISGGVPNGKSIAIFKESMGNALATWACNNYETVYVVDIREYMDGSFDLKTFHDLYGFDDLLVESYPATVESADLRAGLASLE